MVGKKQDSVVIDDTGLSRKQCEDSGGTPVQLREGQEICVYNPEEAKDGIKMKHIDVEVRSD